MFSVLCVLLLLSLYEWNFTKDSLCKIDFALFACQTSEVMLPSLVVEFILCTVYIADFALNRATKAYLELSVLLSEK